MFTRLRLAVRRTTDVLVATSIALALIACGPGDVRPMAMKASPPIQTRGGPRTSIGPRIIVKSPVSGRTYRDPVRIDVVFAKGPRGDAVDMGSLRVTYRKFISIDITERVREHVNRNAIYVPDAGLPVGRHEVEIYVEDVASNWTRERVRITVVE